MHRSKTQAGELKTALRAATQEAHRRVDHHPTLLQLMRPGLTPAHYVSVLQLMARFHVPLHAPLETALAKLAPGSNYRHGNRAEWLAQDLNYFNLKLPADATVPAWTLPSLDTAAQVTGVLYVVEGSALGGKVIAGHLNTSLGADAAGGMQFFTGYGETTAHRWQAYWDFADSFCPSDQIAPCGVAAAGLFRSFENLLYC